MNRMKSYIPCSAEIHNALDLCLPLVDDLVAVRLRRNVRETATLGVVQALPLVSQDLEVLLNSIILPLGSGKEIAEATAGEEYGTFGLDSVRPTHAGNVWACSWEDRKETCCVLSIVGLACGT